MAKFEENQPPTGDKTWQELVGAGITALAEGNFSLGDIALEVAPLTFDGKPRAGSDNGRLGRWAVAIGTTRAHANDCRHIANAYPPEFRISGVPWTVYREFVTRPDRFDLLRKRKWTFSAAQKEMGRAKINKRPIHRPQRLSPDAQADALFDQIFGKLMRMRNASDEALRLIDRAESIRPIQSHEVERIEGFVHEIWANIQALTSEKLKKVS